MNDEQRDELEALAAIYGGDFEAVAPAGGRVRVRCLAGNVRLSCILVFDLGDPASLSPSQCEELSSELRLEAARLASEHAGPCVSLLVEFLADRLRSIDAFRPADPAEDAPAWSTGRALDVLRTLREHVLPVARDPADLVSVAVALPGFLAGPVVSLLHQRMWGAQLGVLPLCELLLHASLAGDAALLGALANPPFNVGRLNAAAGWADWKNDVDKRCAQLYRDWDCVTGAVEDTSWWCPVPRCPTGDRSPQTHRLFTVMSWACVSGSRARGGYHRIARLLHEGPLRFRAPEPRADWRKVPEGALVLSCRTGLVGVIRMLGTAPFSLDARHAAADRCEALYQACSLGLCDVVRALCCPPFSLSAKSVRPHCARILRAVCAAGHVGVLELLGSPPLSLGQREARSAGALTQACRTGRPDIVRSLGRSPWSLGPADAARAAADMKTLGELWSSEYVEVKSLLAHPPYS
eukprot:m51a1_g966 hypothetical protein (466) ;mRNA; f:367210-368785